MSTATPARSWLVLKHLPDPAMFWLLGGSSLITAYTTAIVFSPASLQSPSRVSNYKA